MQEALLVMLALAAGALAGWLIGSRRGLREGERRALAAEQEQFAAAERERTLRDELASAQRLHDAKAAELEAWHASTEAHRKTAEASRKELEDAFAHLAQKVIATNSAQMLERSDQTLGAREKAIGAMLAPFKETLDKLQRGVTEIEGKREKAYGSLEQHLAALQSSTATLDAHSRTLATALRGDARARGRWGEVTLRNVVELAGMVKHCDFTEQETVPDGGRPDMIVNLPGGDARIPVDAKVPMDAYMRAIETEDPDQRAVELRKHAADLTGHMRSLAKRDYAQKLEARVDFTVLFVPGDPILAAAFEASPSLQTEAMEKHVLIATPVTLMALLKTVALYWRQAALADDAQQVWIEGREFHKRVSKFVEHLGRVGTGLASAVKGYNDAVGSYDARVLPQGRRLEELEGPASQGGKLPELRRVETTLREIGAADATSGPETPQDEDAPTDAEAAQGDGSDDGDPRTDDAPDDATDEAPEPAPNRPRLVEPPADARPVRRRTDDDQGTAALF